MEFIGLFKCNFCPSNLHDIESLITHFSIQHLNKELFECEACFIKFWKIPDYYEHRNKTNSTCGGKYGLTMKSFLNAVKSLFENVPKVEDIPLANYNSSNGIDNDIKSEIELNEERISNINISAKTSKFEGAKLVEKSDKTEIPLEKIEEASTYSEIEQPIFEDNFEDASENSSTSHENYRSKLRNSKIRRKNSFKRKPKKKTSRKSEIQKAKIADKIDDQELKFNKTVAEEVNENIKVNETSKKVKVSKGRAKGKNKKVYVNKETVNDIKIENQDCDEVKKKSGIKCKICEKHFHNSGELRIHLKSHGKHKNEMCVCHVCKKEFNSFKYLIGHISSKHPKNLFCTKCRKHFSDQESFQDHIDDFHKINRNNSQAEVKSLECLECIGKVFSRVSSFVMHLSNTHKKSDEEIKQVLEVNNERFKNELLCKICGKLFATVDHLMNHQKKKHGDDGRKKHKCKSCPTFFASQEEVRTHILENHKEKLVCQICNTGKVYSCLDSLVGHKRRIHKVYNRKIEHANPKEKSENGGADMTRRISKIYKFICGQCGKVMNGRTQFKNHEASNCGKNPVHKCNICGKGFASAGTLKGHISIHEDYETYQFVCDFCKKRYRSKHQLNKHRRVHTGERPFQCPHCEKAFGTSAALFVHISTHTGIKRYMCTCGERFSCITGLKGHWRTNSTTCGSDPNKSTKAVGEYMGYRKGKLVNIRPEEEMMMRPSL